MDGLYLNKGWHSEEGRGRLFMNKIKNKKY